MPNQDQVVYIKVNGLDAYLTAEDGGGGELMIKRTSRPGENEVFLLKEENGICRIKSWNGYYLNEVEDGFLAAEEKESIDSSVQFKKSIEPGGAIFSNNAKKYIWVNDENINKKNGKEVLVLRWASYPNSSQDRGNGFYFDFNTVTEGNVIQSSFLEILPPEESEE
jgi:hypothetical protein